MDSQQKYPRRQISMSWAARLKIYHGHSLAKLIIQIKNQIFHFFSCFLFHTLSNVYSLISQFQLLSPAPLVKGDVEYHALTSVWHLLFVLQANLLFHFYQCSSLMPNLLFLWMLGCWTGQAKQSYLMNNLQAYYLTLEGGMGVVWLIIFKIDILSTFNTNCLVDFIRTKHTCQYNLEIRNQDTFIIALTPSPTADHMF